MRAIIITGQYATEREVYYPLYRMQEEGWEVDVAVKDGLPVLGAAGDKIVPNMPLPVGADLGKWQLLILPGGAKAMEYMRQDSFLLDFIHAHHALGGVIGCICHGTQLLISAGLVKGRRISGYYSIRDDVVNAGGQYDSCEVAPYFAEDDRIVTTSHYKHMGAWMKQVILQAKASRG